MTNTRFRLYDPMRGKARIMMVGHPRIRLPGPEAFHNEPGDRCRGVPGRAVAQERTPFPEYTGEWVYTVDVPGSYQIGQRHHPAA